MVLFTKIPHSCHFAKADSPKAPRGFCFAEYLGNNLNNLGVVRGCKQMSSLFSKEKYVIVMQPVSVMRCMLVLGRLAELIPLFPKTLLTCIGLLKWCCTANLCLWKGTWTRLWLISWNFSLTGWANFRRFTARQASFVSSAHHHKSVNENCFPLQNLLYHILFSTVLFYWACVQPPHEVSYSSLKIYVEISSIFQCISHNLTEFFCSIDGITEICWHILSTPF